MAVSRGGFPFRGLSHHRGQFAFDGLLQISQRERKAFPVFVGQRRNVQLIDLPPRCLHGLDGVLPCQALAGGLELFRGIQLGLVLLVGFHHAPRLFFPGNLYEHAFRYGRIFAAVVQNYLGKLVQREGAGNAGAGLAEFSGQVILGEFIFFISNSRNHQR